jgi:hypothetical protein
MQAARWSSRESVAARDLPHDADKVRRYEALRDDQLDGGSAAPAAHAAAKATVDFVYNERLLSRCSHHAPYLVVAQHIA